MIMEIAIKDAIAEIDRLQRENAELLPYKTELLRLAEAVGEKDDPFAAWEHLEPALSRAEAAEAEVKRLQTELALSKPLYSRRQIEARVKLLEDELESAACVLETFADGKPADDVDGIMMRVMAQRNRTALASTGGEHHGN